MPKRTDIHKILLIGSGPIIIGQACEFDYSGTQGCKALKQLGYEIVLVNSNPATIMTDPAVADATYIVPLDVKSVTEVIEKERPDALLPNLGGQSGLNLCSELSEAGVLQKFGVQVIGVQLDAIEKGEDRIAFKEAMNKLDIEMAKSAPAYSVDESAEIATQLGYPVVVRPAYTMGGAGGGLVYDEAELRIVAARGIAASMVGQILIEESILGWDELELEVIRDAKGQMITVCFIENVDAVGVHTGDSFCTAPMLTVCESLQKRLQEYAYKIVNEIEVIGGTNVQFAHDKKTDRVVVIEINPRTSRSSALASKATGLPIALVSAMLAAGVTLDEIPCPQGTLNQYQPNADYVVVKFARWAFEKFKDCADKLGTQMKAVGEVMSLGKTYKEALQKAIRSLETGRYGLGGAKDFAQKSAEELLDMLKTATSERHFIMYEALLKGADVKTLCDITQEKEFFVQQMQELTVLETALRGYTLENVPQSLLLQAKQDGFADRYLAKLWNTAEFSVAQKRRGCGIHAGWHTVPVSGVLDKAYYYSSYHGVNEAPATDSTNKVMILGGGPNRIGQGIEFDYCCVHAAQELRRLGYETIMVNCNPETVSTDYDTSDKLYFEPLTMEDVFSIYEKEKPLGVIAQFGGQTPLNLAAQLQKAGVKILGTQPDAIDLAEDRDRFRMMMEKLDIPMPQSAMAVTTEDALRAAAEIGYPLMVRPSYVLGGRGMEIVRCEEELLSYMEAAENITPDRPILIDRFLTNALEVETDAVCDGEHVFIPAVMEHIEPAGIHSGDSACVLPSIHITDAQLATIRDYTSKIAVGLQVKGLMNMQYAIEKGIVYVLEANPRASRTAPLVSKVCNTLLVPLATAVIMGKGAIADLKPKELSYCGVKQAVFPFNMFPEADPVLGPEMRSTGEVLSMAEDFGTAYFKAQEAAKTEIPLSGTAFISVNDADKAEIVPIAKALSDEGFKIVATKGTGEWLTQNGIGCTFAHKLTEGHPNLLDLIAEKEITLIINTPVGRKSKLDDSYIRKEAIKAHLCYLITIAAAHAAIEGIKAVKSGRKSTLKSLQEYHKLTQ
ncbi:MAG: carbamoyl-phosphate synthase large subunit [Ruthenibacterium sp.]